MSLEDVKTDYYAQLFSHVVKSQGFPQNIINIYNHCMLRKIESRIEQNPIVFDSGQQVVFSNVSAKFEPSAKIKKPYDVLENTDTSYMANITGTIKVYEDPDGPATEARLNIASFPLMLGSNACPLANMTDQELIDNNECPSDPLAYFRIKSSEKILVIQEKLRNSHVFIFPKDDLVDCRTTVPCSNGTVVTQLHLEKLTYAVRIQLGYAYSKILIPVFGLFELLGCDIRTAKMMILKFIPEEYQTEAESVLLPSIQDYLTLEMEGEFPSPTAKLMAWIKHKRAESKFKPAENEAIKSELLKNLFPNVSAGSDDGNDLELRLLHLAHMLSHLVRYLIGIRPPDDRDSWSNKRLDSAGRLMEQLFNIMWDTHVNGLKEKGFVKTPVSYTTSTIGPDLIAACNPGAWGQKKSMKKQNYVDIMKRDTALAVKQQITKVNTPTSRHDPTPSVRSVQPSQYGVIDPFESPEGDVIGLIKNLSITCHISLEHATDKVKKACRKYPHFASVRTDLSEISSMYPVLIDGIIFGWFPIDKSEHFRQYLIALRRSDKIEPDVCIFMDPIYGQLEIYCNSSRPTHPVLVVNEASQTLVIEDKDLLNKKLFKPQEGESYKARGDRIVKSLVKEGCIEYLDAREQELCYLAENPRIFKLRQKERQDIMVEMLATSDSNRKKFLNAKLNDIPMYTHCSIDSLDMFSIMCSLAPKANHQQGPRTSYQAGMIRQSLSMYHSVHWKRFDVGYKVLLHPCRPLFEVQTSKDAGLDDMPASINLIFAYLALPGNQEDGLVLNKDVLQKFKLYKYSTHKFVINSNPGGTESEEITFPQVTAAQKDRYHALDPNTGLPIIGKHVTNGDFILGRVRKENGDVRNSSVSIPYTDEGVIDRVSIENNGSSKIIVKIKIRTLRTYIEGDKLAARYSQKGVCSQLLNPSQLPAVVGGINHGITPDIFANPHGIPSRMTIGMLMEIIASKAALYMGQRINGTTFAPLLNRHVKDNMNVDTVMSVQREIQEDMLMIEQVLKNYNMMETGHEYMAYPDGRFILTLVEVGVCAYAALRHHVLDKFQARGSEGSVRVQTHQPTGGRSRGGGIRFGEMERDSQVSHGASATLLDCLSISSDATDVVYCGTCGILPTYKNAVGDELPEYQCKRCNGRNFCILNESFTFKYLTNVLAGENIEVALDLKIVSDQESILQ